MSVIIKAYQKYQNIKIQKELAEQAAQTAADNRAMASYNQMTAENKTPWIGECGDLGILMVGKN